MKWNGSEIVAAKARAFLLPRPDGSELLLQLSPLALGFQRRLRERGIVPPPPRVKIARDSQGKPLRDGAGNVVTTSDTHHPELLLEQERYHQRVAVLAVSESLRNDPQLSFETVMPSEGGDWSRFADERFGELEAAGFTVGDLVLLCREICRLSNLLDQDVRESQRNFSPAEAMATG